MEFDHVIRVHADGTVTDGPSVYFECRHSPGSPGHAELSTSSADGWSLMRGYTGQHGCAGSAVNHASEFIGGGLARGILAAPGLYVALTCEADPDCGDTGCQHDSDTCSDYESPEPAGWVVAYLLAEDEAQA